MKASASAAFGFGVILAAFACVGSDPDPAAPVTDGGVTLVDASSGGAKDGDSGAATEVTCNAPMTKCGSACVELKTTSGHCGACDHTCLGGSCVDGVCKAFEAVTGNTSMASFDLSSAGLVVAVDGTLGVCEAPSGCTVDKLRGIAPSVAGIVEIAVGGDQVFFANKSGSSTEIDHCPLATGCPAVGAPRVENSLDALTHLTAGHGYVAWSWDHVVATSGAWSADGGYIHACQLPDCASAIVIRPVPPTDNDPSKESLIPALAIGPKHTLYKTTVFADGDVQLRSCGFTANCPPGDLFSAPSHITVLEEHDGTFYGISQDLGTPADKIFRYVDADPFGAPKYLVADAPGVTDVAADASGIYWVNATTGNVLRCTKLEEGCPAGDVLATGQKGATRIRVDAGYVYWMVGKSVMKLAKPL